MDTHSNNPDAILTQPIARYIDHTSIFSVATAEEVKQLCEEALQYQFAAVCVNSCHLALVAEMLRGSNVKIGCTVGFPQGVTLTEIKVFETKLAVANGAQEIDMVLNMGALKGKDYNLVEKDIAAVVAAADKKALVKVIIETCMLTDDEKRKACELCKAAGADFVKTSTGLFGAGATEADVALMRETVGPDMGVKAAGGIRDLATALAMIKAGANRIGTSAGLSIVQQTEADK